MDVSGLLALTACPQRVVDKAVIERSLWLAKVTINDGRDVEFVIMAKRQLGSINWRNLRTFGDPLSAQEKRMMGISGRMNVARQFADVLNDLGRADVGHAANVIAQTVEKSMEVIRSATKRRASPIAETPQRLLPSVMAAGPCAAAVSMSQAICPPHPLKLLPLDACDRLGQCGCMYVHADYRYHP